MKKLLIALAVFFGAIVLFIAGIFAFVFGSTSQEVEVTNLFFETLSTDTAAAYEQSAAIFKEYSTLEDFEAILLDVPELKSVADSKFPTRSTEDAGGLMVTALLGTITLDNGEEMLIEVLLIDEEDAEGVSAPHVAGFDINQEYVQSRIDEIQASFDDDDFFDEGTF